MSDIEIVVASAIALVVAAVGSVTGGNSLVGVPLLIFLGMDPTSAVATNMVGVGGLSLGAALRFSRDRHVRWHPTIGLALLAIPGSILGAKVAIRLPDDVLKLIIGCAMIGVCVFLALRRDFGARARLPSGRTKLVGYGIAAIWAIYGGLFSGGYTTILTVIVVVCFGTSLLESVATTKFVNLTSSTFAVIVFALAGAVDWRVAVPYGVGMLLGGVVGAHWASRVSALRLRQLLLLVVAAMAAMLLWMASFGAAQ